MNSIKRFDKLKEVFRYVKRNSDNVLVVYFDSEKNNYVVIELEEILSE